MYSYQLEAGFINNSISSQQYDTRGIATIGFKDLRSCSAYALCDQYFSA